MHVFLAVLALIYLRVSNAAHAKLHWYPECVPACLDRQGRLQTNRTYVVENRCFKANRAGAAPVVPCPRYLLGLTRYRSSNGVRHSTTTTHSQSKPLQFPSTNHKQRNFSHQQQPEPANQDNPKSSDSVTLIVIITVVGSVVGIALMMCTCALVYYTRTVRKHRLAILPSPDSSPTVSTTELVMVHNGSQDQMSVSVGQKQGALESSGNFEEVPTVFLTTERVVTGNLPAAMQPLDSAPSIERLAEVSDDELRSNDKEDANVVTKWNPWNTTSESSKVLPPSWQPYNPLAAFPRQVRHIRERDGGDVSTPGSSECPDNRSRASSTAFTHFGSVSDIGGVVPIKKDRTGWLQGQSGKKWKISGKLLGKGAYGQVWMGMDIEGEMVAIKEIEFGYQRVEKEISLMTQLQHENVVSYFDIILSDTTLYIVMEYIAGGSVGAILKSFNGLGLAQISNYTRDVLHGLGYLHDNGIQHRDVKPDNILITHNGRAKLTDFGLATDVECSGANTTTQSPTKDSVETKTIESPTGGAGTSGISELAGTAYYISPEVVMGQPSHSQDVWAVGITVLEMVTGKKTAWSHIGVDGSKNPIAFMIRLSIEGTQPFIPDDIHPIAKDFVQLCCTWTPNNRACVVDLLNHPFLTEKIDRE